MNENPENPEPTDPDGSGALGGCPRTEPGTGAATAGAAGSPSDQPATPNIPTTPETPASHTTYGGPWAPGPPAAGPANVGPPPAHSPWPHSQYGAPAQPPGHLPGGFAAGPPPHGQGHWAPPSWPPPAAGQWTASPSHQPPNRKRGMLATALVLSLAVTALLGALVGHAVWSTATSSAGVQNTALPFHYGSSNPSGSTTPSSSGGSSTPGSSGGSASAAAIASKVDPGLVDVNTTLSYEQVEGAGTGMVLTSNGVVLTNNHVVEGETSISVTDIGNGKTYGATVVGYDRSADVAVLQLTDASGLSTVTLASSGVSAGESVVAIGNAGGKGGTPSYAAGTVTATNQSITASDEATGASEQLTGLIETDANIVAGDSGGPLVNSSGQVLAMDTAAAQGFQFQSQGTQGYAIPVSKAATTARQILDGSSSSTVHVGPTAFLGVSVESAQDSGTGTSGALIASVVSGGPSGDAGLVEGDTITSLDGTSISSPDSLTTVMTSQKPGNTVQVGYIDSSGQQHTVSVQLGNGPPQ
jgi:S1-C subfamily serine protease